MPEDTDSLKGTNGRKALIKEVLLKVILPAVLVIFAANLIFRSSGDEKPSEIIEKAEASGNYAIARKQYQELIKEDFFNLEYHRGYLRSCEELSKGDDYGSKDAEFEEYVTYSLDKDPNVSDVGYYGTGYYFSIRHNYGSALRAFNKIKDCNQPFVNNSIGYIYLKLHENKKAKDYFLREIELDGNLAGAYSNYSKILYEEGNFDKLTELISDKKAKEYIPGQVIRIVNLKNGRILSYIFGSLSYNHVTNYGLLAALLILITWFRYLRNIDVFEPEKLYWLLLTLIGGMFFSELCTALYDFWDYGLHFRINGNLINDLLYCIFGIGYIEETVKLIPLLLILRFSRQINESIDYVIYASVSALGFAFMENLIYFQEWGIRAITGRALTSVLLHISLSGIAVYGLIYSKYRKNNRRKLLYFTGGFAAAVVIHGLFDFVLISEKLPSRLGIFSVLILIVTMNKYGTIIKNALNVSEFNTEHKTRVEKLSRYLVYSLSVIILLQYVLMAWKFGASNANSSMLKSVIIYYVFILIIIRNLGKIEITKSKWTGIFEKRPSKMEQAARQRAAEQGLDFDALKRKYNGWEGAMGISWLFFVTALLFMLWFLFPRIALVRHIKASYEYLILPSNDIWFLPSFFLGIVFSMIIVIYLFKVLMGEQRAKEFDLYRKLNAGRQDIKKTLLIMAVVVIGVNCAALLFMFDYYVKVKSDAVVINKLRGFGEISYPYEEVTELRLVKSRKTKKGGISRKQRHEIAFSDGYVFSFGRDNYNLDRLKESKIMNFIAEKCGKEVQIIDPYPTSGR